MIDERSVCSMNEGLLRLVLVNDLYRVLDVIETFLSLKTERERMRFVFGGPD